MPVYKFKTFEDAERALWTLNPDDEYYRRVRGLFEIAFRLAPPKCRRGIFRFSSIEEANEFRRNEEAI